MKTVLPTNWMKQNSTFI